MRFLSRAPGYRFFAKPTTNEIRNADNALVRLGGEGFVCYFKAGGLREYEKDFARANFAFQGVPLDQDGVHPIDPIRSRVSVFDTDDDPALSQDPELKKLVETRLLDPRYSGPENHVLVTAPKMQEPWPNYDKLIAQGRRTNDIVAEKIAARVAEDGYGEDDIAVVVAYEKANLNRPEVLAVLEVATASGLVAA
jgi:hypothetical protein